ncbi:hypothetical protein [Mitsuokella jalaludinii]|uniref:hypothetical protein n=1 Tax=Mitsuokella jalaludinii TaxID=187979 RepID=UPI003A903B9D
MLFAQSPIEDALQVDVGQSAEPDMPDFFRSNAQDICVAPRRVRADARPRECLEPRPQPVGCRDRAGVGP